MRALWRSGKDKKKAWVGSLEMERAPKVNSSELTVKAYKDN
jgi:hypothetical protein